MRQTSVRLSRCLRSPAVGASAEAGVSLVDALIALVVLVMALSVAVTPITVATMRAHSFAAELSEVLDARREALE